MAAAGLSEPLRLPSDYYGQYPTSNAAFVNAPQRPTKVTYAPISEVNTDTPSSAEFPVPPIIRKKYYAPPPPQDTSDMSSDECLIEAA